jgi:hypothetical protein
MKRSCMAGSMCCAPDELLNLARCVALESLYDSEKRGVLPMKRMTTGLSLVAMLALVPGVAVAKPNSTDKTNA